MRKDKLSGGIDAETLAETLRAEGNSWELLRSKDKRFKGQLKKTLKQQQLEQYLDVILKDYGFEGDKNAGGIEGEVLADVLRFGGS